MKKENSKLEPDYAVLRPHTAEGDAKKPTWEIRELDGIPFIRCPLWQPDDNNKNATKILSNLNINADSFYLLGVILDWTK